MRLIRYCGRIIALATMMAIVIASPLVVQFGHAQASTAAGSIQGTVTDPKGAVVAGATVSITNTATNAIKTLKTDTSGLYSAASLSPGIYKVEISSPGFSKVSTRLTVQIGVTSNGDIKLKLGNDAEVIEVSANALQVNTVQSTVQGVLTEKQIDELPISGRNFLDLAQLEPGVQLQAGEDFDPTKAGYSSVSFNGIGGRTARILLDGQDISDETVGTTTLNVSQGSIEEFQISRSSLDISTELTSSGSITVSTRSGGNQLHGQAFGLFRDERAGAANAVGGTGYPFQRNQFGGRLGGAIIKDKLFFFGSFERTKQDSFTSVQFVPLFQTYDGGYNAAFRDNYSVGKLDYNAPKGVHLFFRGAYENNLQDATYGYGYSVYGNKDNTPAFAGGGDFTIGKLTNSIRASYLKFHNLIADESGSAPYSTLLPGIEYNLLDFWTGPNNLAPQQTFQSDKQIRYDGGYIYKTHVFNFGASFNRILGGGFASFFGFAPQVNGYYGEGPLMGGSASDPTAYGVSSAYLGNGQGYNTERPQFNLPAGGQEDWRLGIYFGDTWKVNHKLTINYGIRYSRDTGRSDSDLPPVPCADANGVWGSASPCAPGNATGGGNVTTGNLLDALTPGLGNRIRQPNANWGPKVGFAYDLSGNGKTVVRGGLGLYYENSVFNNVLFDRVSRLSKGLFWNYDYVTNGASCFQLPTGGCQSTVTVGTNTKTVSSLWSLPVSQSGPYFAEMQKVYQQVTATVGAATNGSYVANTLSEGPNGNYLYDPKYRSARSIQMNLGIQRELWKGGIFTADLVRNVGEHFMQSIDQNHVGDATTYNVAAADNAVQTTLAAYGVSTVDQAIAAGATLASFAGNGLDSGVAYLYGSPAAAFGLNPATGAAFPGKNPYFGQVRVVKPMGRSVYNGLQLNYRQTARIPLQGLKKSSFEASYSLSRFTSSGGSDQNFTPTSWDNNAPLAYNGPAGLDRTHQISAGGTFEWVGGFTTSFIGHFYSALPTSLYLDTGGNTVGEIFNSDITGDGTTGDLLPGTKAGAFMRSIKPGDLPRVIANYNATAAGALTPAGTTVASTVDNVLGSPFYGAPLFNASQLMALGATTRTIAPPSPNAVGNGALRTFDLAIARPIKLKGLGPQCSIEPGVRIFNLFNFSNFGTLTGNLSSSAQANNNGYGTPGSVTGTDSSLPSRDAVRLGNGSGVFAQGAARVIEYGLKINF
jgi:hypothetical protein